MFKYKIGDIIYATCQIEGKKIENIILILERNKQHYKVYWIFSSYNSKNIEHRIIYLCKNTVESSYYHKI
jgi:hypothetical protein